MTKLARFMRRPKKRCGSETRVQKFSGPAGTPPRLVPAAGATGLKLGRHPPRNSVTYFDVRGAFFVRMPGVVQSSALAAAAAAAAAGESGFCLSITATRLRRGGHRLQYTAVIDIFRSQRAQAQEVLDSASCQHVTSKEINLRDLSLSLARVSLFTSVPTVKIPTPQK
ncbi:hypothetical protein EVAR_52614_1 [Eumeta japonica]|uniref:Uncharacterized protein n=1 Tax=Eumeta variegata TaxID=151549 RepID=A0A4C1YRG0_EUMVA|nr:hypothetical protein EVAR_52614_1 [Eumeta japonica]